MNGPERHFPTYGGGLGGLLGTAFIVLKLCGVIEWSWWWVLSPFWVEILVVFVSFAVAGVIIFKKGGFDD